jgi:hypothetical protein
MRGKTMNTALQTLEAIHRHDMRKARIMPLVHAILEIVRPHLNDERDLSRIYDELAQKLYEAGAEIVTDDIRAQAGLPPRGPDGWTDEDLRALELARLNNLLRPLTMAVDLAHSSSVTPL